MLPKVFTQDARVRQEIEAYVNALNSYPEHFAQNPAISFEQHLFSVVAAQASVARRTAMPAQNTNAA